MNKNHAALIAAHGTPFPYDPEGNAQASIEDQRAMAETASELKPCPFCGGKCIAWRYLDMGLRRVRISCEQCVVQGPSTHEANEAAVIAAWNTRARIPAPGPAGEADDLIEPVAWRWFDRASENYDYLDNYRGDFDAYQGPYNKEHFTPLFTASALAACQAREAQIIADCATELREAHAEYVERAEEAEAKVAALAGESETLKREKVDGSQALSKALKRAAGAEASTAALQLRVEELTFIVHHAALSELGIHSPDDTDRSCIGVNSHKLKIAKVLAGLGVVNIENSPNGPIVSLARTALNGGATAEDKS